MKTLKVKKPKLTEEEKRERIRSALLKKKSYEDKALKLVENLLELNIDPTFFLSSANYLNKNYYSDVVEERALTGICGYPLCDRVRPEMKNKGKFHISLKDHKVYNIEERKLFCSNHCFKASNFFLCQLETSPLWMRETDCPVEVRLYQVDKTSDRELDGAVVDIGANDLLLGPVSDNVELSNQDTEVSESEAEPVDSIPIDQLVLAGGDAGIEVTGASIAQKKPKKTVPEGFQQVFEAVQSWFTVDSFRIVHGEEELKARLRENSVTEDIVATTVGDKDLGEQYQAQFRDICRKLDMLDREDGEDETENEKLPTMSFEMLRIHCKEENMKLSSYLSGRQTYEKEMSAKPLVLENSVDAVEPRVPLLDHCAQQQLRHKLVLDSLHRVLPDLLNLLNLSLDPIRSRVKQLVRSFQLSADNVMFKSDQWTLICLITLKLVSVRDENLSSALDADGATKIINLVLLSHKVNYCQFEQFIRDLSSDIMELIGKYKTRA